MRILWFLVCTVSAQDFSEARVKVIELERDLEPVPLATLLANKWLTCDVSDVVDLRAITNTTTEIDDFDYGSPDGTFEHPPLRRTSRTTWQLMSRALEWEVSLADGTRRHVAGRLPVEGVGSKNDLFYYQDYDKGFFNTVLSAYAHHWGLTTTPEDWWYTIVRKVAMAIDNNAEKETVRDFFVSHEGKKELRVELGNSLYTADYTWFFQQMANQVDENIKQKEYVRTMRSDFSTSTPEHGIATNIAIMSSTQEFFQFVGGIACGIPRVEMLGSRADWEKLRTKFSNLNKLLESIKADIGLNTTWWDTAGNILEKLLDTYDGNPDTEWWKSIIVDESYDEFVVCGFSPEVGFSGWFMTDFLNQTFSDAPTGITSAPLTIRSEFAEEEAAVVAGIVGFNVKEENNIRTKEAKTSIQAKHAWALLLDQDSVFRKKEDSFSR